MCRISTSEFLDALRVPHHEPGEGLAPWNDERAWQREFLLRSIGRSPLVIATSRPKGLDAGALGAGLSSALE
jgi:hypothetical protein